MAAADKLDGADIYIAYGRYGQARDLLRQVLAEQPQRLSARMKLLLVLAELGDAAGFDALAEETLASGGNPEAIDELRGRYPALLQMPATETPAATTRTTTGATCRWPSRPFCSNRMRPRAPTASATSTSISISTGAPWRIPWTTPTCRAAAAGKAEPAEAPGVREQSP